MASEVPELNSIESLPVLQDAIKKDPESYRQDFENQYGAFKTQCELFEAMPQKPSRNFDEVLMFIAHTCAYYQVHPDVTRTEEFVSIVLRLIGVIFGKANARPVHVKTLLSALFLLDNRNQIDRYEVYPRLLKLLSCENNDFIKIIIKQLIKGIGCITAQHEILKWQKLIFEEYRTGKEPILIQRLTLIIINLYLKGHWKDARTANFIAEGLFHKLNKVIEYSARFILGDLKRLSIKSEDVGIEVQGDEEEAKQKQAEMVQQLTKELSISNFSRKKKSRRKIERLKEQAEKNLLRMEGKVDTRIGLTFEIMDQIYDPHKFVERVFQRMVKPPKRYVDGSEAKDTFKIRLLCFTVAARMMGRYQVLIPGFLEFFNKYINPKQDQVTRILAILAQAVHEEFPTSEIQACTKAIADAFVVDSSPNEAITIGVNAIREMCKSNKNAVTPELLEDLLEYGRTSSDPSVKTATASLRNYYRIECPQMLKRRYRSAIDTRLSSAPSHIVNDIEGMDVLKRLKEKKRKNLTDSEAKQDFSGATTLLSQKDFQLLKKIKLRNMTAKSLGINPADYEDDLIAYGGSPKSDSSSSEQCSDEGDTESTLDSSSDSDAVTDSEDSDVEENDETVCIITGDTLQGNVKLTRSQASILQRLQKSEKRKQYMLERLQGKQKHRAGITNKVAARNKPMAMVRQKRDAKLKASQDARTKVARLKAHIKTLKTQKKQRMRRR